MSDKSESKTDSIEEASVAEYELQACPNPDCDSNNIVITVGDGPKERSEVKCAKCGFHVRAFTNEEGISKLWNCQG